MGTMTAIESTGANGDPSGKFPLRPSVVRGICILPPVTANSKHNTVSDSEIPRQEFVLILSVDNDAVSTLHFDLEPALILSGFKSSGRYGCDVFNARLHLKLSD